MRFLLLLSTALALSPVFQNYTNWIGDSLDILGPKTLKELTLPGTHDSGAYHLTPNIMPDAASSSLEAFTKIAEELITPVEWVLADWGLSQNRDFYAQMQGGIRYFDLRAGWDNTTRTWKTYHFLIGDPVQELLSNIGAFLHDFPKEIVIVETSHFDGFPTTSEVEGLKDLIVEQLGEFLYPVNLAMEFTVNDMVNSGKRVLVTMQHGNFTEFGIWPGATIHNTYADSPDPKTMQEYNYKKVKEFEEGVWCGSLFKVSWTLTPDTGTILDSVLAWKPHSLLELADLGNALLPSFWLDIETEGSRAGNILIVDHFERSQLLEVVLAINGIIHSK